MANTALPFYTQTALLDQIMHSGEMRDDPVAIDIVLGLLRRREDLRAYFFRSRPHHAWAKILWNHGFLSSPPSPVQTEHGEQLLYWDAQAYLISVASDVPEIVIDHVNTIEGHPTYIRHAVSALKSITPVAKLYPVIPRLVGWLTDYKFTGNITEATIEIIKNAIKEHDEIGLVLFDALLTPFPSRNRATIDNVSLYNESVSTFNGYFGSIAEFCQIAHLLLLFDEIKVVAIIEKHLVEVLRLEDGERAHGSTSPSWRWRSAIEISEQNYHNCYKDDLLDMLRDAYEALFQSRHQSGVELLESLLRHSHELLRRLGIHLLRMFHNDFADIVGRELTDPLNYDTLEIHHEFMLLLREGYPLLDTNQQKQVIDIILAGPPLTRIQQLAEFATRTNWTDQDIESYVRSSNQYWIWHKLEMVKEYLSGEAAQTHKRLSHELCSPDYPEFLSWHTKTYEVEKTSPFPTEIVAQWTPQELIAQMRRGKGESTEWGSQKVTIEGFAATIAKVVLASPSNYATELCQVLSIRPEYTYAIVDAVKRCVAENMPTDEEWKLYLTTIRDMLRDRELATSMIGVGRLT